ncbi:MAG: hypothetical protein AAFY76_00835 [Cyanobacteria bacterium J06649_11]
MKSFILLWSICLLLAHGLIAQDLVAVQNGGNASFYTELDSAVFYAQAGDTVYIPGKIFSLSAELSISKQLFLIGVGHNPDSSTAYNSRTKINGDIRFLPNSSGSEIVGVYTNSISIGDLGQPLSNITIDRCNVEGITVGDPGSISHVIKTSIIRNSINGGDATELMISNNIIDGSCVKISDQGIVQNNIFFDSGGGSKFSNTYRSIIKNNIFIHDGPFATGTPQIFTENIVRNNLSWTPISFASNGTGNPGTHNEIFGNESISGSGSDFVDSVFLNVNSIFLFSYSKDYRVIHPLAKNAGTDGTDLGIYGGTFPWKNGSVPFNPHVQQKAIAPVTDSLGRLPIQIKVRAQNN